MLSIVKVFSTEFDKAKRRVVKFLKLGKEDVQTSIEVSPFGVDSNPHANLRAIYAPTGVKGQTVIIGYINVDQVAEVGEHRMFSTDTDGNLILEARMRNDGTFEIGGSVDNLVRFAKLDIQMQKLSTDINVELVKIASGIATGGGAYTPAPIGIDISTAKIDELKTS